MSRPVDLSWPLLEREPRKLPLPVRPMTKEEEAAEGRRLPDVEPHSASLLTTRIKRGRR